MAHGSSGILVYLASHGINTKVGRLVLNGTDVIEINWQWRLRVNVLQVPLERLAVQFVSQFHARRNVTSLDCVKIWNHAVEVVLVLICPDVNETTIVAEDDLVGTAWK